MSALTRFITGSLSTLLCLVFLNFVIIRQLPIDPALLKAGENASQKQYEAARLELGLDKPLLEQFCHYLNQLAHGKLGVSSASNHPVEHDLKQAIPATLELATVAFMLSVVLALPLGMLAALYQNHLFDQILRIVSLIGSSSSVFWIGLMALVIFYVQLDWLPGPGRLDDFIEVPPNTHFLLLGSLMRRDWPLFQNALSHLVLPSATLAFFKIGHLSRFFRSLILEQMSQDYVLAAKIRGSSPTSILWREILPNALLPMITALGLSYASLLEGSTFVETIYLWPGLGFYLTQALLHADLHAILSTTLVIGCFFIIINQLTDSLNLYLNPRAPSA